MIHPDRGQTMHACRPLTEEEIDLVMRSFGGKYALRDKALFMLGILSGFRITELLSLKIGDLYQDGTIHDTITVQRRTKRGVHSGAVVLPPQTKSALQEWLSVMTARENITEDTYLFKSRKGQNKPISRIQALRILKEAFDSCEITGKLGTQSMRKTFVQWSSTACIYKVCHTTTVFVNRFRAHDLIGFRLTPNLTSR